MLRQIELADAAPESAAHRLTIVFAGAGFAGVEAIADESLGSKRRSLLDDLCASDMQQVDLKLSDQRRSLEANAESIRAADRRLRELTEQIEELGDVKAKCDALPASGSRERTPEFQSASRQKQANAKEASRLTALIETLTRLGEELPSTVANAAAPLQSRCGSSFVGKHTARN